MSRPPDPHISTYKTIKTSLSTIATDYDVIFTLEDAVINAHRIAIHTLQFLKMYLIHSFDTTQRLPTVDHALIINIMKTLAPKQTKRGRPPKDVTVELKNELHVFYLQHYQPTMVKEESPLSYEHMNTILQYMAITIETGYLNNIKQHFVSTVERYVNVCFDKKSKVESLKTDNNLSTVEKRAQLAKLSALLRHIKTDILSLGSTLLSPAEYHEFILQTRTNVLPLKTSCEKNSVYYDLQASPQDYLLGMFLMLRYIESQGASIISLFPLRSSIIPKYIKIDTTTLVHLLVDGNMHGYTKGYLTTKGNLVRLQDQIWSLFFKTGKKCFYNHQRHKYRFNYMIETDGVGCSIQLIRQDLFGRTHIRPRKSLTVPEKYIDEASIEILRDKRLVAIDPNLSDLLYCVTKDQDRVLKLRYTQNQRRKESKSKKYQRSLEQFKAATIIEGQSVVEWETQFSAELEVEGCSSKTLRFEKFQMYVQYKNRLNNKLLQFYEIFEHRRLKWYGYVNRQKSESRLLNRFKALFGSPDQVVIGIGDYEQHQHRKYKEPVKGKGFRKMFRRAGYKNLYLVDEHKTSCRCHNCGDIVKDREIVGGERVTFRTCKNPRPWRKEESIIRHGLLMCQTCQKLWCRDTNASLNIWEIMKAVKEGKERPKYLQRGKVSVSNATSALQQV
jgi:hypothetical protein